MNHLSLPLVFLCLFSIASSQTIEIGLSEDATIEALGEPVGSIELRDKTLLLYPQGEVTLRKGVVTEVDLMTKEEFDADQARLKEEREEWHIMQEKRALARKAEGEALKKDRMTSQTFASLPAKDRVDYWRTFQIRYPEVDASMELASALRSYQSELSELKNQEQIAQLEARVARAEQEAAAARLETEKLRTETERTQNNRHDGLRYYTDPVITNSRYLYRPPTITIYSNGKTTKQTINKPRKNGVYYYDNSRNLKTESVAERATRILSEARQDQDTD